MKVGLQVVGVAELTATFKRLVDRASDRTVQARSLKRGAEPIRDEMAQRAPRSDEAPHIADNIVIDVQERGVIVGPRAGFNYGFYLEYGTSRMSAQPFMRPALDNQKDKAIKRVGEDVWRTLARGGGLL